VRALERGPDFRLAVLATGDGTVVAAAGELDLATAPEFESTLRDRLAAGPVVLDLRELRFMDSSGVRVLDTLLREADEQGWRLTVRAGMHRSVRQVLELTGMMAALPLEEDA
jgi:anti-anti-sigma factor